ncbi:MAG: rRNA pseudouridine synthase [Candidatus Dependentiae bacterium]|nr:rRNA pseudouridine synthase [Candidatus Dependentiae bacterium]
MIKKEKKVKNLSENTTPSLSKFIAQAGFCSRRKAVELIESGKVTVNGKKIINPAERINDSDTVKAGSKVIRNEQKVYILLNKPKGYVTTVADEHGRHTVMDLLADAPKVRLYPVGRLDRDTTGLLILTNDGELTQSLAHPSHNIKKIYIVTLDKPLQPEHLGMIKAGIRLKDGLVPVDALEYIHPKSPEKVKITIHSGKYRVIRRLFGHLEYHVHALDRVFYAHLSKKGLPLGRWRFLTKQEVLLLKKNLLKKNHTTQ